MSRIPTASGLCLRAVLLMLVSGGVVHPASAQDHTAVALAAAMGRSLDSGEVADSVRLLLADVPEVARSFLFLPPGSRLLGSIDSPGGITVFAATTLSPDSVEALYARELPARG
ncbi:MAG: hypothetical protein IRZ00_02460 [Gemmatimonadetes bacterium]|nr:hypothetical protein [Gemmatimonadota bacterium]